jgi:MtN3 and saliva related transmembrane protein
VNRALLTEVIGWTSSLILLATIVRQVWRQWHARRTDGVSSWLFVGQFAASVGFTTYSVLLGNDVFIVTNATLALTAVVGWALLRIHRRREAQAPGRA